MVCPIEIVAADKQNKGISFVSAESPAGDSAL